MNDIINGVIGISGCLLTSTTAQDSLTTWVSVICSAAIALVTCGLQIYRMIRDRDKDDSSQSNQLDDTSQDDDQSSQLDEE